ncbi:MAG: hypothetical protein II185_05840 [Firmicutes bacterium]|nr:hypothetical protein [Bacillota bacterium]
MPERVQFWKKQYIREHIKYLIIGLVICAAIIFYIAKHAVVELPLIGWVGVGILVVIVDLYNFNRRMREYVANKLMEEERNNIPDDDLRYVDVE